MKVFISQGVIGHKSEDISAERKQIIELCKKRFGADVQFAGFIEPTFAEDKKDILKWVGRELAALAECDVAVFSNNYYNYKPCTIEQFAASAYDIKRFTVDDLNLLPEKSFKKGE